MIDRARMVRQSYSHIALDMPSVRCLLYAPTALTLWPSQEKNNAASRLRPGRNWKMANNLLLELLEATQG